MKQSNFLLSCASFIVIIAGMKVASPILIPFLLAAFITILTLPILLFLNKNGIPKGISVFLIILILLLFGGSISFLLGSSISGFSSRIPFYTDQITNKAKNSKLSLSKMRAWNTNMLFFAFCVSKS